MMIEQSLAEVVENPSLQSVLASSVFTFKIGQETYQKAQVFILDDCMIFKIRKNSQIQFLRVNFNFDLIFDIIRTGQNKQEDRISGNPTGIRFERFQKTMTLTHSSLGQGLLKWRQFLETKLNQRGFHEIFKPIKKVGKGNFATVYLVVKHEDSKKYAVKAFSKEATYGEDKGKQSLINQIEVMRKFNHKNLMKLHGIYESNNSIYISVELLEGGQLYDKIKQRHKFTSIEIKTVMKGILEGLEVMHANNIMHRDLKPENILLRKQKDYDCVIADFGLAEDCRTKQYMFVRCGTPGYVAPEVVNLKDLKAKYSPICDMFSLGVIFHLLVLRKSPFPGKEYDEVLSQNRQCKFNFETQEYLNLPESWLNLLKGLLQKEPKKRITATQALNHQFFTKDNHFTEFFTIRNSVRKETLQDISKNMSQECQSPLMVSRNMSRKEPRLLRDDSCLKFKMKENVMTGRTDQSGETVDEINSPMLKKKESKFGGESRFKRMAKE